jgi:hypothetical protein
MGYRLREDIPKVPWQLPRRQVPTKELESN